jgi:1-acyl-sn-glycerol-3-phosphate acyltransferase
VKTALATLTGNVYLVFGTLFWAIMAIVFGLIPPRGHWTHPVARLWSKGLLFCAWLRVETRFAVPLDPQARYVYMANHQSLFDIPVLLATLPGKTRFLAKKSLFQIPIFGWAMSIAGFIPVDRRDRSTARDMFAEAIARLRAGVSLLVFPEETRSLDGKLHTFQRGGFLLAMKSGLPIVPVGVQGTFEVQSPRSFAIRPRRIVVSYGEPMPTEGIELRAKRRLVDSVRTRVGELSGLPDAESGAEIALPDGE